MDLDYLLFLQGVREGLPGFVTQFFVAVSAIAASAVLVLVPCFIYWCLDKRGGQFLVFSFALASTCNQLVKSIACVYRPWVRSPAIRPVEAALPEATGYSFPSGHTQVAASVVGGLGYHYRKRWPALFVGCWVLVALVALSRNVLGVHAPQDVLVAITESVIIILLVDPLLRWVDDKDGRDAIVAVAGVAITLAFLVFCILKEYPVDYDATGAVLVDPKAMVVDCYKSAGASLGAFAGWFLERRLVGFETNARAGWRRHGLRLFVGIVVVVAMHLAPRLLLLVGMTQEWYELVKSLSTILATTFVAPMAFSALERRLRPVAV